MVFPGNLTDEQIEAIRRDPRARAYYANRQRSLAAPSAMRSAAQGALDFYRTGLDPYLPQQLVDLPVELYGQLGLPGVARDAAGQFQVPQIKAPRGIDLTPESIGAARMSSLPPGFTPAPVPRPAPMPTMSTPANVSLPTGATGFDPGPAPMSPVSATPGVPASINSG